MSIVKNTPPVRAIKSFLVGDEFDNKLLEDFYNFHTDVVSSDSSEAIIYINSCGGDVTVLNSIIGLMSTNEVIYHTVNLGLAASAGCLLCGLGHVRWASPLSTFLFHDAMSYQDGNKKQIKENQEWMNSCLENIFTLFASRTKKNLQWWEDNAYKNSTNDFCFQPQQALDFGVVDAIGVPKIRSQYDQYIEYPQDVIDTLTKKNKVRKTKTSVKK